MLLASLGAVHDFKKSKSQACPISGLVQLFSKLAHVQLTTLRVNGLVDADFTLLMLLLIFFSP